MTNPTTPIVPVVLSGGAGTRLWPASRAQQPKQLLRTDRAAAEPVPLGLVGADSLAELHAALGDRPRRHRLQRLDRAERRWVGIGPAPPLDPAPASVEQQSADRADPLDQALQRVVVQHVQAGPGRRNRRAVSRSGR